MSSKTEGPANPPGAPVGSQRDLLALTALTLLALVVRAAGSNNGLWVDEIYSLLQSFRLPLSEIVTAFPRDNHHPLYSVLAHLSRSLFGEFPWTIRLPSVLFGAATVPLLFGLARQVATRREAWFATALLAVSYHHVWFSQNARGYVMLAFFTIACTWCLIRLLQGGSFGWAVAYGAAAALGGYAHLTMVFVVSGHAAVCLVLASFPRTRPAGLRLRSPLLWAFGLAAAGTLLLYAPVLLQVRDFFVNRPSPMRGVSTPGWALGEMVRVLALGLGAGRVGLGLAVVAVAGFLFAVGLASYASRNGAVLALFLAPALAILAGAVVARGTFYPRFLFSLIGFGILIGVRGVMVAAGWIERRWRFTSASAPERQALGTGLMLAGLALSMAALPANYRYPKQDFGGAARFIEAQRRPEEAVATSGAAVIPFRDYLRRDWAVVANAAELERLRREHPVWLVYTFPRYLRRSAPEIMRIADASCPARQIFPGTVGEGDIYVCRLPAAP